MVRAEGLEREVALVMVVLEDEEDEEGRLRKRCTIHFSSTVLKVGFKSCVVEVLVVA